MAISSELALKRAEAALARYSNPWNVEVQNVQTGSWLEVCHDAPLTLADAEQRMYEHRMEQLYATFRVVPWLNPQQRQHVEREKNAIRDRLAESERLAGELAKALRELLSLVESDQPDGHYTEHGAITGANQMLIAYDRVQAEWKARE